MKQEARRTFGFPVIDLSSSSSDSELEESPAAFDVGSGAVTSGSGWKYSGTPRGMVSVAAKRAREASVVPSQPDNKMVKREAVGDLAVVLPERVGQSEATAISALPLATVTAPSSSPLISEGAGTCKSFWKAGDYEGVPCGNLEIASGGFDHVRVHPKFLHSNATSHKWALGAFAELLDNALDEIASGATHVNIDMIQNRKNGSKMLLVEDNGGGMNPDKMRQCMSLGYSAKSKIANTIGQYGNGFKTSTMRLGADVIVFSRCPGNDGNSPTQSIGLLSYTFLKSTGKQDIVVPMLDYERRGSEWRNIVRSSNDDWNKNVETIVQWSPFSSEEDLLSQFNLMKAQGTRIIIYNLWEDEHGMLELDFDADPHDIQLRGVNRDQKNIEMASKYPNSHHYLTYKHSLRSYVSILYLRIPPGFRILLRGRDVKHHNIVNDMMQTEQITYRPQHSADGAHKDSYMSAVVTIGFVKDAKHHIDVQGFNVYHKNRLIKPFWRIWNAAGSDGRGVIGVLEANFVEPAHDKQGFERTTVLSRLEARLVQMQKTYWGTNCDKIGYAPRRNKKSMNESSPEYDHDRAGLSRKGGAALGNETPTPVRALDRAGSSLHAKRSQENGGGQRSSSYAKNGEKGSVAYSERVIIGGYRRERKAQGVSPSVVDNVDDEEEEEEDTNGCLERKVNRLPEKVNPNSEPPKYPSGSRSLHELEKENRELQLRLKEKEEELANERKRCKNLEAAVGKERQKLEEASKEQEALIDIFAEERDRRDREEDILRDKLEKASNLIQELTAEIKKGEQIKAGF